MSGHHMDADLYSAALYCLTVLGHRLPAFPVFFDDFAAPAKPAH